MIFSGESGLGKSYAAFLVHYLYILLLTNRIQNFLIEKKFDFQKLISSARSNSTILEIDVKELFDWINLDAISYIGYLIGNDKLPGEVSIEIPYSKKTFVFTYHEELGGMDNHEELFYKIRLDKFTYQILSSDYDPNDLKPWSDLLRAVLTDTIFDNFRAIRHTFLMPPSRGALMELNERPAFRSGMYNEFFDFKAALNRPLQKPVDIRADLAECMTNVNSGSVQEVEGRLMYYTADGAEMPLTAAASSIKEMAPFTLFLNKFSSADSSILLEEPEAHLHPKRQIKVADLVACAVNSGCNMQITTHSDYFIKRLNTLIKLYIARTMAEDTSKIDELMQKWDIRDSYLINPDNVGAYLLSKTGAGSHIESQSIAAENGIPFESFYETIENDFKLTEDIHTLL